MAVPITISACVICKNQVQRIGLALDSLAWCEEILVIDSGSTDGTLEVCRNHPSGKVRVVHQDFLGFNPQRRFAAGQCRHEWVFMLDADEECSPELRGEIERLREQDVSHVGIFEMSRKNFVARRHVRCWGPDWQRRLIHKGRITWGEVSLPELREPKPGFSVRRLGAALLHNRLTPYTPTDFCDGKRMEMYSSALAESMRAKDKRAGFLDMIVRPKLTFIKYYLLKGGFLQGRFGLAICYKTTIGVMLKYSALYGKELEEDRHEP